MLTILVIVLLIAVVGGGFGHHRGAGPWMSWSPLGIILVIVLVLWLTGHLRLG